MKGASGGKRGGRKPTSVEPDDRPRGYEATRMRELWRDIDHAKRKAGLDPAPEPVVASLWGVAAVCERASVLAGDAAAWVAASAPTACALLAGGAELLRDVPVVGWFFDLVPRPLASNGARGDGGREATPDGHANGNGRAAGGEARVVSLDEGESNGEWSR